MLTVFRSVLPGGRGPPDASVVVKVGTLETELAATLGVGRRVSPEDETARVAVVGEGSSEDAVRDVGPMLETRDFFGTGKDGRGPVGGAIEGRGLAAAGRGSEAMIL